MKNLFLSLVTVAVLSLSLAPVALVNGCKADQQRITFNSINTVETATTTAVDGYFLLVAKGIVPTNGVPTVSKDFNKFQGGVLVALDLVQGNSNALAPSSLQQLSTDLISEIQQFRGGK